MDDRAAAVIAANRIADPYLRASDAIDWTAPEVVRLSRELGDGIDDQIEVARRCFEWVRDEIPHTLDHGDDVVTYRASEVLRERTGFCFSKSHLLVALLRANGIRAGLGYQRLTLDSPNQAFCLHGLVVVDLPGHGWYRVDPRGNTRGIHATFTPPRERLAYAVEHIGEVAFPKIYPEPVGPVVRALDRHRYAVILADCLPDAVTEFELEH